MIPHQKDKIMKQHLEQWKAGDSTQTAYCHQHNIPIHIFSYYKKKLGYGSVQLRKENNSLIPVSLLAETGRSSSLHISHNNGFSVEVPPTTNLNELKPVLELLRSLS
jgi:hypothetical protein